MNVPFEFWRRRSLKANSWEISGNWTCLWELLWRWTAPAWDVMYSLLIVLTSPRNRKVQTVFHLFAFHCLCNLLPLISRLFLFFFCHRILKAMKTLNNVIKVFYFSSPIRILVNLESRIPVLTTWCKKERANKLLWMLNVEEKRNFFSRCLWALEFEIIVLWLGLVKSHP